jgi:L-lysine 2,3-aminomutase
MSTRRLVGLLRALHDIPHVKMIRVNSKMPAFAPWRLLDDLGLQKAFRDLSICGKRIYLMAHFDQGAHS